jgi:hypothetical protein
VNPASGGDTDSGLTPRAEPDDNVASMTDAADGFESLEPESEQQEPTSAIEEIDPASSDDEFAGVSSDDEIDWDAHYADPEVAAQIRETAAERAVGRPLPIVGRSSANGSVMAAVALGFKNVFQPDAGKQEIIQERDDSGDPDNPNKKFHLDFDPEDPKNTRAIVRYDAPN